MRCDYGVLSSDFFSDTVREGNVRTVLYEYMYIRGAFKTKLQNMNIFLDIYSTVLLSIDLRTKINCEAKIFKMIFYQLSSQT